LVSHETPWVKKAIAEKNERKRKNTNSLFESSKSSYSTELDPVASEERQILGGVVNRRLPAQHELKASEERQNIDAAIAPSEH
jgi:hypothetical protein